MQTKLGQAVLARPQKPVLAVNQLNQSDVSRARLSSHQKFCVAQSTRQLTCIAATKVDHEDLEASVLSSVNIEHQEEVSLLSALDLQKFVVVTVVWSGKGSPLPLSGIVAGSICTKWHPLSICLRQLLKHSSH